MVGTNHSMALLERALVSGQRTASDSAQLRDVPRGFGGEFSAFLELCAGNGD